ncbi:MAG TPA: WhiB family transcriptional regulator [Acidimicrobiia bacterium]|jgi:WhiB family redox-sensing transcriptional regulator|nr:WhiB family transcriptional regulator [Acidimicrobiia bacterium]
MNDTLVDNPTMTLEDFLHAPITEERPWVVFAACRDADPDVFFPSNKSEEREALALCAMCPVINECQDYSMDARETFGVWGGLTEKQRKLALRRSA